MARFMLTYLGGDQPSSPDEGRKQFNRYQEWLTSLGDSVVSPMNPIQNTHTVSPDGSVTGSSSSRMSGYTVIEAESIQDVVAMAQKCPFLAVNGTLEVSEMIKMTG